MNDKTKKILLTVAGVFIVFIIILFIISSCSNKKFNFDKFQDDVTKAAKNYYKNKDELPKENGESKKVTIEELVNSGYLKDPAVQYKKSKIKCDGSVTVLNNNGIYNYSVSATCGNDYQTKLLSDKIQEDSLVESGIGLYKDNETLVYKGEVDNNYLTFNGSDKLFRIIKINKDGTIRLIEVEANKNQVWDNRYNPSKSSTSGINDYMTNGLNSRIKDVLNDHYNNSAIWTDDIKNYILTQDLCIGKRYSTDSTKDGSTECSVILNNQKFGLLAAYEFLQASLDENCVTTDSIACQNYNWLANDFSRAWLITADASNDYKVWWKTTNLQASNAELTKSVYAVFNIPSTVVYVSGNGTKGEPYKIR